MIKLKQNDAREGFFTLFHLLTIGVVLSWVMVSSVIDTTIFSRAHEVNFIRVFIVVAIFGLIFTYDILGRIAFWIGTVCGLYIITGFAFFIFVPETTNITAQTVEIFLRALQFAFGTREYTLLYEQLLIWLLIIAFSFLTTYFSYRRYRFWVLNITATITTGLMLTSPYFSNELIFHAYIFTMLVLLIMHFSQKFELLAANHTSRPKINLLLAPVIVFIILIANLIPTPPIGTADGFFHDLVTSPFNLVNNFFSDLSNPADFSISSVGFGGEGYLGGDVELNHNEFMRISVNSNVSFPLYLTGTTRDTYTGYAWRNTNANYEPLDLTSLTANIDLIEQVLSAEMFNLSDLAVVFNDTSFFELDFLHHDYFHTTGIFRQFTDFEHETLVTITSDPNSFTLPMDVYTLTSSHRIEINTGGNRIASMFHSGVLREVNLDDDIVIKRNRDGAMLAATRLDRDTRYIVHSNDFANLGAGFLTSNPVTSSWHNWGPSRHEEGASTVRAASYRGVLQDILNMINQIEAEHPGYYMILPRIAFGDDVTDMSYADFLSDYLIPRSEMIHEIYTQLPDDLPDRVRELALEVTEHARNDYEKMQSLEWFLGTEFPYTLTPGTTPEGRDFVDYFLFDLQRGYCVHFATAFVVMARSLGMPTRYVEGFAVPRPAQVADHIPVLNSMAHAWPEVYFEGVGWVAFEPTASYFLNDANHWEEVDANGDNDLATRDVDETPDEDTTDDDNQQPDTDDETGDDDQGAADEDDGIVVIDGSGRMSWMGLALVSGGLFVVASFAATLMRIQYVKTKEKHLMRLAEREVVDYYFQVLLRLLVIFQYEVQPYETELMFMKRIFNDRLFMKRDRVLLQEAVVVYVKARYSNHEITVDDAEILKQAVACFRGLALEKLGKWRYRCVRFIIGKI